VEIFLPNVFEILPKFSANHKFLGALAPPALLLPPLGYAIMARPESMISNVGLWRMEFVGMEFLVIHETFIKD